MFVIFKTPNKDFVSTQRSKTVVISFDSRSKGAKPQVFNKQKQLNFKHKA